MRLEAKEVAKRLQYLIYYSDSSIDKKKASALAKQVARESQIIVIIGIFSFRINHTYIQAVFYIRAPINIINFIQEAGRTERDNKSKISYIFLLKNWKAVDIKLIGKLLPDKIKVIQRYLDNPQYRLLPLGIFLNKVPQTYKGESILCDQYRELGILVRANKIKLVAASELREDSVGILEGVDKSKSSSSIEDLLVGSRLLKQYIRN